MNLKNQYLVYAYAVCSWADFSLEIVCTLANQQRELKPFRYNGYNVFSCPGRTL